jgi:hypothetical protein
MEEPILLVALVGVASLVALRVLKARQRRQLRDARCRRRAEEKRRWEEMTGQFLGEDWRP